MLTPPTSLPAIDVVTEASPGARRRRIPMWAQVVLTVLIVAAVVWFLAVPQFSDAEASFAVLQQLSVPLVIAALLLEALSLLSFSVLTGAVLGWGRLRYTTLLRIDLSDLAVNHTTPGGGAVAGAVRFKLFVSEGIPARMAISAATMEIAISNLALALVFLVGVVRSDRVACVRILVAHSRWRSCLRRSSHQPGTEKSAEPHGLIVTAR